MLYKIVNQFFSFSIVLKKAMPLVILLTICFSLSLSAKTIDTNPNDLSEISITGNAIVFDAGELSDDEKFNSEKVDLENQKAEIFIADGVLIYNIEAYSNAKIIKLEKKEALKTSKQSSKKTIAAKPKNKSPKQLVVNTFYNSQESSEKLSQSGKDKVEVLPCRFQYASKGVTSFLKSAYSLLFIVKKQDFIYTDPSIKICYFSGKHSVRPPTS